MIDVSLEKIKGYDAIIFRKTFWNPGEIEFAKCLGMFYDVENNKLICVISRISKRPLFSFIKNCFKSFNEDPINQSRREEFYKELKSIYEKLDAEVGAKMELTLPYNDMLFKHQSETIKEAYHKQYNFLAFEMGLGKTITSASLSRLWQSQCTLIVCPAAVKWNWYRDLCKFKFNELFFTILDSSKKRSIKGFQERFIIVNFEMMKKFEKQLLAMPIQHFIIDEAHNLKNISTDKFKNLNHIIKEFPNAKITMLSGTPIKNRVDDVYAYLKLIGHELGQNKNKFLNMYTYREKFRVMGGKNLDDLRLKLSNFFIRKTKEECLDLPEKTFLSYRYDLDDYRQEYDKLMAELEEQNSPAAANGNIHALNNVTSKAKVKGVVEIVKSIVEQGRKAVVFSSYSAPLAMLEERFKGACVKIDGSVNSFERDKLIQKFHDDPECKVFLGNMIAAGVGINLTNASDVVFVNYPFTPAELHQAIDRCHRIGQANTVNVHLTFCEDSLDDYIYDIILSKEVDINKLVDNDQGDTMEQKSFTEILLKKLFNRDQPNRFLVETPQETKTGEDPHQTRIADSTPEKNPVSGSDLPEFI